MKNLLLLVCFTFMQISLTVTTSAQTCTTLLQSIKNAAAEERADSIGGLVKFGNNPLCFAEIVAQGVERQSYSTFLKYLETHRTDKQAGSSVGTGGTTNLVSKGVTARVLSVAAEYGALTESVSNQVVTVQGSLDGIPAALVRQDLFRYCVPGNLAADPCPQEELFRFLRRLSYSVSFDASRNSQAISGTATGSQQGTAQPVTFTPTGHQVSSITGRFVLWNARDATSDAFQKKWRSALTAPNGNPSPAELETSGARLLLALQSLLPDTTSMAYQDWQRRAQGALTNASNETLESAWDNCAHQLVDLLQGKPSSFQCGADPTPFTKAEQLKSAELFEHAMDFVQASSAYLLEENLFVAAIADKPVLTFEYDNNRPLGQSSLSTFRLIFDRGLGKNWSITANGAFTIYDTQPPTSIPGSGRLRDSQVGMQVSRSLGSLAILGPATLSGTYYFQYQNSPAILNANPSTPLPGITLTGLPGNATQVFTQKGNLHVAQLRLALGTGQSNVRFPIAFSYSNRTELIAKPEWRAQIGVTYDFDSLFAGK
jgi:hypothetical protein